MAQERIEQALARLDAATARAEAAAALVASACRRPDAFAGLEERHDRLKHSVALSLRQLDELLAGPPR